MIWHRKRNITLILLLETEFLWKDFSIHSWGKMASLFSLPGVEKPLSWRLNHPESFIHLWKSHRSNFSNCMLLNGSRSTIKLGNKVDSLIHWYFVKTTFLDVILFLAYSSSFHYHLSTQAPVTSGETTMNNHFWNRRPLEIDCK